MASKLNVLLLNPCHGLLILPCVFVLCLVPFPTALSHGLLVESVPTHGSVLRAGPDRVVLHFNAILEPSITQVNLIDRREGFTPLGVTNASTTNTVVVKLPPLQPGVYNVRYKVLATDGHVTEGSIRFTVITR